MPLALSGLFLFYAVPVVKGPASDLLSDALAQEEYFNHGIHGVRQNARHIAFYFARAALQ